MLCALLSDYEWITFLVMPETGHLTDWHFRGSQAVQYMYIKVYLWTFISGFLVGDCINLLLSKTRQCWFYYIRLKWIRQNTLIVWLSDWRLVYLKPERSKLKSLVCTYKLNRTKSRCWFLWWNYGNVIYYLICLAAACFNTTN